MTRVKSFKNAKAEELVKSAKEMKREFILKHFSCRECVYFVPNKRTITKPGQIARCYCGEYEENHYEKDESLRGVPWTEATHLKYFEPTKAFGQIDFLSETETSQRPTEFVRISDKDKLEDVMELMKVHWNMMEPTKPTLCISVIGGAKNFVLEGRRKDVFNTGLIQAAQTTNAWIITSGLNLGIVRVVGDALQEGQTCHFDRRRLSNQLRCLGISPWGYVLNRNELICNTYSAPVPYRVSNIIETGRPVSLNQNHTHYIFVDEGRRLRYGGSESARFRARLGKQMALPQQNGGWGIPVILVVVEGGHDVFIDARDCIRERIPVVICSGTGRAADVMNLAFTFRMKHQVKEFKQFRPEESRILMQKLSSVSESDKLDDALAMLTEILSDPQLITTFDMNKSDDLDLAILYALIKTNSRITTQLKLAFTWDRSDIAEEKIFQQGVRVEPESLEPTMMDALLRDKPEFVRILLQNGIVMRQFLTLERLHCLYNKSARREGFERCLAQKGLLYEKNKRPAQQIENNSTLAQSDVPISYDPALSKVVVITNVSDHTRSTVYLNTVSRLARKMIGRFANKIYEQDTEELHQNTQDWAVFKDFTFVSPFQELFLWAVLHQRQRMALFFWERAEDALALALIACALYSDMIKSLPDYDTETQAEYEGYMNEFEMLAVRLLEECNTMDPETTLYLVENEAPLWGGYNCLNLADKATRRKFVSSVACQNSLYYAWSHGTQASPIALILTLFCPLLLFSDRFVEFDEKRTTASSEQEGLEIRSGSQTRSTSANEIEFGPRHKYLTAASDSRRQSRSSVARRQFKKRLKTLYTAPRTKFFLNSIAYIIFLLFFSYTLLFKIASSWVTIEEAVTMTYFVTLLIDVIRQICVTPGVGSYKLRLWVKINSLVYLDVIAVLLALISMFLRIGLQTTFIYAKTFYALTLIICYMRIFRLYGFHPALGPKLVMIQRMIAELILFLFILAVMLLSYGIAVQSLLYPNRIEFDWNTIRDVLYYPYFNLYGEINVDYSFAQKDNCTGDPDGITCPYYNFVVPLLLSFYLLLAGILLINLLIAIFSNVFQQVEDNSIELWKFNMYALVVEYNKKPVVPVPLSVFQAVVEFFRYLVRLCNRNPGVARGVKEIASKSTDIQRTITGTSHLTGDLDVVQNADTAEQNDEGTQLFEFITPRSLRRFSSVRDLTRRLSAIPEKSAFLQKSGLVAALDDDDEDIRIARQFETNCKRSFLQKQKRNKEQTIDAGISSIKSRIDELQAAIISVADRLEIVMRESPSQVGSDHPKREDPSKSTGKQKQEPTGAGATTTTDGSVGGGTDIGRKGMVPVILEPALMIPGSAQPTTDTDETHSHRVVDPRTWSFGQPYQTSPISSCLDPMDEAMEDLSAKIEARYKPKKTD